MSGGHWRSTAAMTAVSVIRGARWRVWQPAEGSVGRRLPYGRVVVSSGVGCTCMFG